MFGSFSLLVAITSSQNSVAVCILYVSSTPIGPERSLCAFGISAVVLLGLVSVSSSTVSFFSVCVVVVSIGAWSKLSKYL